jgi:hypothetical protein
VYVYIDRKPRRLDEGIAHPMSGADACAFAFAPKTALGGLEIQLPLYRRKQTSLGNRGMSDRPVRSTRRRAGAHFGLMAVVVFDTNCR